ncbi:hypothetical protein HRbin23_01556 [bacterium HR23]|nr:hypothetical protein HRbin23_01556 [bacterium HR23]
MPIYEYVCERSTCSHHFELRQGFDAEPVATCPLCHSRARRRISPVPIIFKGSGWYVTDYGRKNPTLSSAEDGASAKGEEEKTASGEQKSAPSSSKA